jgi:SAM-dependent methyltransferase
MERYLDPLLDEHGPTPRGVDWNSTEAQEIRFEQLLRLVPGDEDFSILDYGCGYGALAGYLRDRGLTCEYTGYDFAPRLAAYGRELFGDDPRCRFVDREEDLEPADYTVASGLLNLKFDVDVDTWTQHVLDTLQRVRRLSRKGFAFNVLTSYSDPEKMRPDLYYADPGFLFDHCKRHFSRNVALLHDYELYEFTVIVRLGET